MNHHIVKHYVSIAGMVVLGAVAVVYLWTTPEVQPTVLLGLAAGIAGLGGYNLRRSGNGNT